MKKIFLILVIGASLFSCKRNDPMDRTIFIPDPSDPDLPIYSEWGYNTFGAEYDRRDYFISDEYVLPCKIMYKDNQLIFSLNGKRKNDREKMEMVFTFDMPQMNSYKDLLNLHDKEINLADTAISSVKITRDERDSSNLDVISGRLYFQRVQLLRIDDVENRIILSGWFAVQFNSNGTYPVSISNGRFDVGVTKDFFFLY